MDQLISKAWTTTNTGQFAIAYESFGRGIWILGKSRELYFLFFWLMIKIAGLKKIVFGLTLANLNFNYGHFDGP